MAWIQQAVSLPFILVTLLFARFYWPSELSGRFWVYMAIYVVCGAIDLYCYFKALSLADISYIAPLMTLVAVGNILGAYFVLDQMPSVHGLLGATLIVFGASAIYIHKRRNGVQSSSYKLATGLILLLVAIRSYYSNTEVFMVRESNATTFNFYSSALTAPFILLVSMLIIRSNRNSKFKNYWQDVKQQVFKHKALLLFIGLTYTINMIATYIAKVEAPNAGYVGAIKSASVLPMTFIGVLFFKEKMHAVQWAGVGLIIAGLVFLGLN